MKQNGFFVSLRKTEKVDVSDENHALPPDHGPFDEFKVSEYFCPKEWSKDGIFVKIEEGEPLWIDFRGNDECAVLCSIQRLNPITGEPSNLEAGLTKDPKQNYLRLPEQLWLDGYVNDGKVYQFVATKAGEGLAVSEYALPKNMQDSHALGFAFFSPKNPKKKETSGLDGIFKKSTPNYAPYDPLGKNVVVPQFTLARRFNQNRVNGYVHPSTSQVDGTIDRTVYCLAPKVADTYNEVLPQAVQPPKPAACKAEIKHVVENQMDTSSLHPRTDSHYAFTTEKQICDSGSTYETLTQAQLNDDDSDFHGMDVATNKSLNAVLDFDSVDDMPIPDTVDILEESVEESFDKASMGMGGRIVQGVHMDDNTTDYYQEKPTGVLIVYLALPDQFEAIMKKGKRQDAKNKDKYTYSGKVGSVQVPLVK